MLFWLKKAVSYWLMPLPFCLALMLLGLAWLRWGRRPRTGKILAATGALLLVILSSKQVGGALLRPLEDQYPAIPELPARAPVPPQLLACRVIVVLGGGHVDAAGLSAIAKLSSSASARITEAVRLARVLPGATLIVSGPSAGGGKTHASVLAAAAVSLGVDAGRIVQVDTARDTDDEVQEIRRRIGSGIPFALVTSAWHMPRAMGLMRRAGLHPVPCPADFLARANADFRAGDWSCDLSGLEQSTWAIYEGLGITWARMQGKWEAGR
ncbi:MAG: hypothetical protein JWM88_1529 [Verrucomicrobia bacterium]|nr:hypothetical protein [Verrucomicrobiota bacterium]